jgi:hypothetical protein
MLRGAVGGVLAALALGVGFQLPAAAACPAAAYVGLLDRAAATLHNATGAQDALALVQSAERVDARSSAILAPILSDLSSAPPDLGDARTRLGAIVDTLAVPPGSSCNVDPAQARRVLNDVYRSRAFAGLDQGGQPGFLERIAQALGRFFATLGKTLGLPGGIGLGAAALLLIAALLWWRVRASAAARIAVLASAEPADRGIDADAEWSLAMSAAERGDYREAIRRAFRSALLDTAARGRLAVDVAWTTRELLGSAAGDADLVAGLAPAAAGFDHAWYSGEAVGGAEWDVMRSRCEAIRRLARRRLERSA